ncbi:antitoxin HicB [Clavibacter michiganensis]|uniref:antitoxin HicB n=1 Tax=Clavibacter michiganensis TaxID=28447 RepID=UPI000CE8A95B|nr:antitoxin HicB [Clavibacter michiganensis]PPF85236.1 antitoxin HicB [Clavibacter michiganensis]PPF92638.1 antitoxin HicB [Clavibacter michiganensis]
MTAHTYDVDVWREGRWWLFRIPELDTVGQARSLAEVPEEAEGIIEAWNAAPPAPFELNVTITPPVPDLWDVWAEAAREEEAARNSQAHAAAMRRKVVKQLRGADVSVADVSAILGVSRQRVYQLQDEKTPA